VLGTLLKKNKVTDAHVRIVLTGGPAKNGLEPTKPNLFVLLEPRKDLPAALYTKGASLITFEHQRPFATAKTTNYQQAVVLQQLKKQKGAVEILYTAGGKVLEAATSNVCVVKGGVLYTPKDDVLKGVTLQVVLELAKARGYKVVERVVRVAELWTADEVFITATNKKVVPIVRIDGKVISNGKPGPVSQELNSAYIAHIVRECGRA
jgi:branched-subunit amino acid aminotransferase/4-amino-4-deoxychorismate lyase